MALFLPERPGYQTPYDTVGPAGGVADYTGNDGAFNQGEYSYQSGSQAAYEDAPQQERAGQQLDYEGDFSRAGQKAYGDYSPPGDQQPDYYDGDASAVAPSSGVASGNTARNARGAGKMGYGGGLLQYGSSGQNGYGGGLQQYGSSQQSGYGGGGGGGGGLQQYGSKGYGGYQPQYGSQQSYGYSYGSLYQQQQKPRVIKVIERVPVKEKVYVPVYRKRKRKSKCI